MTQWDSDVMPYLSQKSPVLTWQDECCFVQCQPVPSCLVSNCPPASVKRSRFIVLAGTLKIWGVVLVWRLVPASRTGGCVVASERHWKSFVLSRRDRRYIKLVTRWVFSFWTGYYCISFMGLNGGSCTFLKYLINTSFTFWIFHCIILWSLPKIFHF